MAAWSPTLEGFRAMFRRPSVSFAEIMWRWTFGAAACFLLGFGFLEYLDTLPVSNVDRLLLGTRHPVLISNALSHILEGSALRFATATIVLFSALAVLWILVSSLGRGATLHPLLSYIRDRARASASESGLAEGGAEPEAAFRAPQLRSLIGLNFLRASLALAACASILGGLVLAGFASSKTHPRPGTAFLLSCVLVMVIWLTWSSISWFLSAASIFVVRQGETTFGSLASAVEMCRDRFGSVMAVGTWFGLTHLVLFFAASSVVSFPLGLAQIIPPGIVLSAVLLFTLIYFAAVDTLHIGRLAAYAAILETPPMPPSPSVPPPSTPGADTRHVLAVIPSELARVDQDELILSDAPMAELISPASNRVDPDELLLSEQPDPSPPTAGE